MLKPIKNKKQYEKTLTRIYDLMQRELKPGSKESDEPEVLSIIVEDFEEKNIPYMLPTPLRLLSLKWKN